MPDAIDTSTARHGSPADSANPADSAGPSTGPRWRQNAGRALAGLAAATTLLWVGAIVYGAIVQPKPAGWLEDRRFPTAAEPICADAVADVDRFPPAHESPTPEARATVIRESTGRLATMLDDLDAVVPEADGSKWIRMWLADWRVHLDDRLDFARRLDERGASEEFFESLKADTQISKSLDNFAEINAMPSCATTGDV